MFIRKMRWMPIKPIKLVYDIAAPYGIYVIGPLNNEATLRSICGQQYAMEQYSQGYYYYPQQYYTSQYYETQQ